MFDNATDLQIGSFLTISAPYTFPSGNAARVAALVFALLLHPARARVATFGTKAGTAAAALSAAALTVCAWGHLATRDHWASDVLGGLILGAAAAFALGWMTQRHEVATAWRPPGGGAVAASQVTPAVGAPFDRDPVVAARWAFDRRTGTPVERGRLATYRQMLAQYHLQSVARLDVPCT
jgi:hypothetical protein